MRKETGERKSYAIDRPFFLILFEAGQIETEMLKINRRTTKPFFGLRAARPIEVPNSRLTPPLLHDLKKGFQ